jgi:16S rRNA (uracil1498-N3)-methyltransferase
LSINVMTSLPRLFVPTDDLHRERVLLSGEAHHHLCHVLRARIGDLILLLDGRGLCCQGRLEEIQRLQASVRVLRRWHESEQSLPVTLIQALPKGDKFDLVLQKGTELGVSCFQPIETTHSIPVRGGRREAKSQERWQRIIAAAARQCRRSILPELKPICPLAESLEGTHHGLKLVLWEAGAQPLRAVLPAERPAAASLLVGPEGGFSQQEISTVTAAGFQAVHLGPRILRSETASLAVTPVLQYLYGDWQAAPTGQQPESA